MVYWGSTTLSDWVNHQMQYVKDYYWGEKYEGYRNIGQSAKRREWKYKGGSNKLPLIQIIYCLLFALATFGLISYLDLMKIESNPFSSLPAIIIFYVAAIGLVILQRVVRKRKSGNEGSWTCPGSKKSWTNSLNQKEMMIFQSLIWYARQENSPHVRALSVGEWCQARHL